MVGLFALVVKRQGDMICKDPYGSLEPRGCRQRLANILSIHYYQHALSAPTLHIFHVISSHYYNTRATYRAT